MQIIFGEMNIGGNNTIEIDHFFRVENIGITEQMDASSFEGILYWMLPENLFNDQNISISDIND